MIIGGVELISHRHHGGLWYMAAPTITGSEPSALPPQTLPESATQQSPSTQRHGSRAETDLATKVTLGLWALYIPNLVVSTGLRVLAWGTGTANTQEGSVPGSWGPPVEGGSFGGNITGQVEEIGGIVYGPPDW